MKSIALILSIVAVAQGACESRTTTNLGEVKRVNCASCSCTGATGITSCATECTAANLSLGTCIWDFYNFLVKIGPTCKVQASMTQPIELLPDEFCVQPNVTGGTAGFIVKQPKPSNIGLNLSITRALDTDQIHIYQITSQNWYCGGTQRYKVFTRDDNPSIRTCPIIPNTDATDQMISIKYDSILIRSPITYNLTGSTVLNLALTGYSARDRNVCVGDTLKVEWITDIEGEYTGLTELPRTTPPSKFSSASSNFLNTLYLVSVLAVIGALF